MRHLHGVRGEQFQKRIVLRLLFRKRQKSRVELRHQSLRAFRSSAPIQTQDRKHESEPGRQGKTEDQQHSRDPQAAVGERIRVRVQHQRDRGNQRRNRQYGSSSRDSAPTKTALQRLQITVHLFKWVHRLLLYAACFRAIGSACSAFKYFPAKIDSTTAATSKATSTYHHML